MPRCADRLTGLDTLPPHVAWKLVDSLFRQTGSTIGAASALVTLAVAGWLGTGSRFYLIGLAYTVLVCGWRLWQARCYVRAPGSATPTRWACRSMLSSWATAAGWGAWTIVVQLEPRPALVMMVFGIHAGLIAGGAVRNCAIPAIAVGQVILASVPFFLVCATSGNPYLQVYAGVIFMHVFASLALVRTLHGQTVALLLKQMQAGDLVSCLEAANRHLEASNEHLGALVVTDALTGASNRRAFDSELSLLWRRAARERTQLSLLLIDVDQFKSFNDFYGHQAGDFCLQAVAAAIGSTIFRAGDMLARYGGEEFALILPDTTLEDALVVAERVIAALAERNLEHQVADTRRVTLSIGVAAIVPTPDSNPESLISLADAALYAAKRAGRNRAHAAAAPCLANVAGPDSG